MRFALAMNGGVSLAIWIGGVANEVLRLCRRRGEYAPLVDLLNVRVHADVLNGASAGGINAVFLALALLYEHDDLDSLRNLWIHLADFDRLLRDPLDADTPSLLRGDDYFLVELRNAIGALMVQGRQPRRDLDLDVQLTATSLTGQAEFRSDDIGGVLGELRHGGLIRFLNEENHFQRGPGNIERLARACRSTASFPGAFEASFVRVRGPDGEVSAQVPVDDDTFGPRQIENVGNDRFLLDGGVLVNLPVGATVEAIFSKWATSEVRRVMAMVVPDPATLEVLPPDQLASPPALPQIVAASASTLPRTQSVGRFLDDLRDHNDEVRMLSHQRLALLEGAESVDGLQAVAAPLFAAYRAGRLAGNASQAEGELAKLARKSKEIASTSRGWREAIRRAFAGDATPPWIPASVEEGFASAANWGTSVVERSYGRLIYLVNQLPTEHPKFGDLKIGLYVTNQRARKIALDVGTSFLGPEPLGATLAERVAFIEGRWLAWPGSEVESILEEMAAHAESIGSIALETGGGPFIAALPRPGEGVRFLQALEVVECAFGDFRERAEQEVGIVQIDSLLPAPIDPLGRTDSKVAGIQLGHFGGFLKRSWRANDWMWGRLDAATHLCRILVMHERSEEALPALADKAGLPPNATAEDIATTWAKRIQREILVQELPVVADAVRADNEVGALAGTFSTDFLSAYESQARASLQPLTPDLAVELLGVERIGQERLEDERGGDLVTRASVHALATATTVVQRGSPTLLRAGVAAIRYVALLTWALTRTAASRNRMLNTIGALLFGAGLVGVALDLFTGVGLGLLALPAWVAFGAGVLLAFARAPVVVVPLLAFAVVPRLALSLFSERWSWVPQDWEWWPSIDAEALTWVPIAGFIAAGLMVGLVRRPRWLGAFRRHVTERLAALDSLLRGDA